MWEYQRARTMVTTALAKYSTRPIPASTPMTGTNVPTSRPAAPVALAVPSQGRRWMGRPPPLSDSELVCLRVAPALRGHHSALADRVRPLTTSDLLV